jgi:hypothetical protein
MLGSEARLQTAVEEAASVTTLAVTDRRRLAEEVDRTRAALMRCRRLGASLEDFVRASFEAHGGSVGYGPRCSDIAVTVGRAFTARG